MYYELKQYLSKYINVTESLMIALEKSSIIREYKKGVTLLREGEENDYSFFILNGCVRKYIIKDGEDITIDIYTDEMPVLPTCSSNYNLECLIDSIVLRSSKEQEVSVMEKFPELQTLCLKMSELMADKLEREYSLFKSSKPEERYLTLLESKPELFNIVPQYQIASYLGIKPESLSRIKKRLNT